MLCQESSFSFTGLLNIFFCNSVFFQPGKDDVVSPAPDGSKESTPSSLGPSAPEPSTKPLSPGRDENCGLRIAVTKAADHMRDRKSVV